MMKRTNTDCRRSLAVIVVVVTVVVIDSSFVGELVGCLCCAGIVVCCVLSLLDALVQSSVGSLVG